MRDQPPFPDFTNPDPASPAAQEAVDAVTVVIALAQLLQRRVRDGRPPDPELLQRQLAHIEAAGWRIHDAIRIDPPGR